MKRGIFLPPFSPPFSFCLALPWEGSTRLPPPGGWVFPFPRSGERLLRARERKKAVLLINSGFRIPPKAKSDPSSSSFPSPLKDGWREGDVLLLLLFAPRPPRPRPFHFGSTESSVRPSSHFISTIPPPPRPAPQRGLPRKPPSAVRPQVCCTLQCSGTCSIIFR